MDDCEDDDLNALYVKESYRSFLFGIREKENIRLDPRMEEEYKQYMKESKAEMLSKLLTKGIEIGIQGLKDLNS